MQQQSELYEQQFPVVRAQQRGNGADETPCVQKSGSNENKNADKAEEKIGASPT